MTTERMVPLYEAKMVHHYDQQWSTYGNGHFAPSGLVLRVQLPAERGPVTVERMLRVTDTYWCRESVCLDRADGGGAFFSLDTDGILFHTADELAEDGWDIDAEAGIAVRALSEDHLRLAARDAAQRVTSWERDRDASLVAYGRSRGWIA